MFCWLAMSADGSMPVGEGGGVQPQRSLEDVAAHPVYRLERHGCRSYLYGLGAGHIVEVSAAQVLDDVACVSAQLVAHALVDLCQVTILVVVLMSPLGQTRDDALQVFHAILVGLHVVVAQVFGLRARVFVAALTREPAAGMTSQEA